MNINNNSNKKFTFVYPDFEYTITKQGLKSQPGGWYHEGIAQLSSLIESLGWEVSLIHLTEPVKKKEFLTLLNKHNPNVIGFSVRTGVREYAKELTSWASELQRFVIVGSYHPTLWPKEVIKWKGVDAICLGEGERPVRDLLTAIDNNKPIQSVGSLWVKDKHGKIHKNVIQPFVTDLDELPLPKFNIFDFSKLIASQIKAAVVVLTRGCPYQCTYCWNNFARNLYPNKHQYVRFRSPKNCIKYIKQLKKHYPDLLTFRFQDDLWPFYNEWFPQFSKLYIEKIHIPFECHLRANLLKDETIKRLQKMKCFGIYFGVESGNEYIRNTILKRAMTEKMMLDAFAACRKYGIRTHAYNIVGLPYEDMQKVLDTVKLNARLRPTDMFFPIYFPYAGSELYHIALKGGFYDPKKPLDPDVNIEMTNFKRNRIRFSSLYAKTFVRLYQFVFKAHPRISRPFEKILDALWLFPYWPFQILNAWIVLKRKVEVKLKDFIKKNFFWLYLFLKGKDFSQK